MRATPAKLRDGSWGARVEGEVAVGDTVHVVTRAGKEWDAMVSRVIWTGKGVSIVATGNSSHRKTHNGECRCGACDDLLSFGYRLGQKIRCPECGGWAEAC